MRLLGVRSVCALVVVISTVIGAFWLGPHVLPPARGTPPGRAEISSGWALREARTLPAQINSIVVGASVAPVRLVGLVFTGTSGGGGVYRFNPSSVAATATISEGLGDATNVGQCHVNRLALHDMDGDGRLELIGSTSQVYPRGRPRLMVWSSDLSPITPRALARPDIKSSWSHSLGFLSRPGQGPDSAFITYCGHGEIVEFRMKGRGTNADGFHYDELGWKVVGNVPASGEWLQVCDADNDGTPDVCVATGFLINNAAVLLYRSESPGSVLRLRRTIDEGRRFGNVRFQVADLRRRGEQELIAWWCTDLAGGDCEMIIYHLGPEGVRSRSVVARGPASEMWPDDGQFTVGDVDGDGHAELWFATHNGCLWRYAPCDASIAADTRQPLRRMADFHDSIGPIAVGPDVMGGAETHLYLARGRSILNLAPTTPTNQAAARLAISGRVD